MSLYAVFCSLLFPPAAVVCSAPSYSPEKLFVSKCFLSYHVMFFVNGQGTLFFLHNILKFPLFVKVLPPYNLTSTGSRSKCALIVSEGLAKFNKMKSNSIHWGKKNCNPDPLNHQLIFNLWIPEETFSLRGGEGLLLWHFVGTSIS